jgi:hypothetical protein
MDSLQRIGRRVREKTFPGQRIFENYRNCSGPHS